MSGGSETLLPTIFDGNAVYWGHDNQVVPIHTLWAAIRKRTMRSLRQLLAHVDSLDDDATIYAAPPWNSSSKAVSGHEHDAEARAAIAAGLEYMLEVNLAREAIQVWSERRRGMSPTLSQQCDAVIYYAEHDAHIDNV